MAFINLEAAGGGGRNLLFQADNTWIMKEYSKSVLNFKGNSIYQDIFQSGLVPADTDYKSYSNFGMIGIDTAFYENGHIYHTNRDSHEFADSNSIEHMGQSTELFVHHMLSLNESFQNRNSRNEDAKSHAIYFDFLSFKLFVFNTLQFRMIVIPILIIGAISLIQQIVYLGMENLAKGLGFQFFSFLSSLIFSNLFALIITFVLKSRMSWYTVGSKFGILLYSLPTWFGLLFPFYFNQNEKLSISLNMSNTFVWLTYLSLGLIFKMGFTFFVAILVTGVILLSRFGSSRAMFYLIVFVPSIYIFELEIGALEFVSAILGRGYMIIPEFAFATIVCLFTNMFGIFVIPHLIENKKITKSLMGFILFFSLGLLISTCFIPPYSRATPKRVIVQHLINYQDETPLSSMLAVIPSDSIDLSIIPNFPKGNQTKRRLFFLPTLGPPDSFFLDVSTFDTMNDQSILKFSKIYSKESKEGSLIPSINSFSLDVNERKIEIECDSKSFLKLIVLSSKCKIVSWSLDESVHEKSNGTHFIYSIRQTNGFHDLENIKGNNFNLKLKQIENCESSFNIEVNSYFWYSSFNIESLNKMVELFPNWISVAPVIISTINKSF
jgi:hypothetical protein